MKKNIVYLIILLFALPAFSQNHVYLPKEKRNRAVPMYVEDTDVSAGTNQHAIPYKELNASFVVEQENIGHTWYDLQSEASISTRIYYYDDNTLGVVFTMGINPPAYMNRGTGYNYFNGTQWGPYPESTIETMRAGWPAYQAFGANGEIVVAHLAEAGQEGLIFNMRPVKFEGNWVSSVFSGLRILNPSYFLVWRREEMRIM